MQIHEKHKNLLTYVYIVSPCFWETNYAEVESARQGLKYLLKWLKVSLKYTRCKILSVKSKNIVVKINIRVVFIINKAFLSWKRSKWQRFKTCVGSIFGLTFNVFTPDHNRTIIQINNLIFLLVQKLYLLPEFSSVFKCLLGRIFVNKYVAAFQLSSFFRDILCLYNLAVVSWLSWIDFLTIFGFLCSMGFFYDNFFNV